MFLREFNQDLGWGKVEIIYILSSINTFQCCYSNTLIVLFQESHQISKVQFFFFCISNIFGRPAISLMCLSVPFTIIPRATTVIITVVGLRWLIFFQFPGVCIHYFYVAQLAGAVEYATASLQRGKTPPKVCTIHRLHLWRNIIPSIECPDYNAKQYDGEDSVILELWGMLSTPSLPSLPGPLWPGVEAPDTVLSMGQKELNCVLLLTRIV